MLNYIWLGLILCAVIFGGMTHRIDDVAQEGIKGAKEAVEIALKLIGVMALWLGVMRLAERAGLVQVLARALRPLMRRLFPDVPPDHPAMGAMLLNMAANILGIGNAATPLGLRAMRDLQKLNPRPGTATNAMCTFLAINTSSIQLIPANQVAMLAAAGAIRPTAIIGTALVATTISTIVGISAVKLLEKLRWFRLPAAAPAAMAAAVPENAPGSESEPVNEEERNLPQPLSLYGRLALIAFVGICAWFFYRMTFPANLLGPGHTRIVLCDAGKPGAILEGAIDSETTSNLTVRTATATYTIAKQHPLYCPKAGDLKAQIHHETAGEPWTPHAEAIQRHSATGVRMVDSISVLAIPFLLGFFPLYAALRRIRVYEEFVEGAKEGFNIVVTIIPHVVAMLVAVFMFRAAGGIDLLTAAVRPVLAALHFPPELLPMSLMRPISGGGTTAIFIELIKTFGPDHLITRTAGTIIGSTETTLYVLAVYFGSVAVRRARHALLAGLLADAAGIIASVLICRAVFG